MRNVLCCLTVVLIVIVCENFNNLQSFEGLSLITGASTQLCFKKVQCFDFAHGYTPFDQYSNTEHEFNSPSSDSLFSFFFRSFHSNTIVFVTTSGIDEASCGTSQKSACHTVSYAYKNGNELILGAGVFIENTPIIINGTLSITGHGPADTTLKKESNSTFVLFTIEQFQSNLTITRLTVLLASQSNSTNCIRSAGINTTVYVTLSNCRITVDTGGGLGTVYGQCFYVNNSAASPGASASASLSARAGSPSMLMSMAQLKPEDIELIDEIVAEHGAFDDVDFVQHYLTLTGERPTRAEISYFLHAKRMKN